VYPLDQNSEFSDFVEAVQNSGEDEGPVRETRHTSSVSSSDWKRVEAARKGAQ
jgi:hypothetical protein